MLTGIFWFSVLFIFYAYAGYPLLLLGFSWLASHPVNRRAIVPPVSFIIAAYNEEKRIEEKIRNTRALDYPKDKLEIIVASDGSSDRTDEIVRSFESQGVRLVRAPERKGKENAQRYAVEAAGGEILVFSDTATVLEKDGLSHIVSNFNDPTVGCVSSTDRFIDPDGKISGEGTYVQYEMWLREIESRVNSVVGLSGSFFAARREVCRPWASHLQSDFNTLLNSIRKGFRGVSDPESVGYYRNIADGRKEFERKVRTVLRGISVFMGSLPLLNPFRYGLFAWQLFSHKLCRWLVPFAMILALGSNLFLATDSVLYRLTLLGQILFYSAALGGRMTGRFSGMGILRFPLYFVMVNLSILNAWYRYLRGDRLLTWNPSQR
jgi:glycosyltransferase involved in cell wall biosynthesis